MKTVKLTIITIVSCAKCFGFGSADHDACKAKFARMCYRHTRDVSCPGNGTLSRAKAVCPLLRSSKWRGAGPNLGGSCLRSPGTSN